MNMRFMSELIGTTFLLMTIVGSGIMGENLSQGNLAIALLANSLATGFGLFVLIQNFGPISGAHFNPLVTLIEFLCGKLNFKEALSYWGAQFLGGIVGVFLTHLMFNQEVWQISSNNRSFPHLWFSEFVATFGLITTITLVSKKNLAIAAMTIAAYIASAYWFSSSTSFANPAVTFARGFTDTFCGIAPQGIIGFILAQITGTLASFFIFRKW